MKRYAVPYMYLCRGEVTQSSSYVEIVEAENGTQAMEITYDKVLLYEMEKAQEEHEDDPKTNEELIELIVEIVYQGDEIEGDEGFFIDKPIELPGIDLSKPELALIGDCLAETRETYMENGEIELFDNVHSERVFIETTRKIEENE